MIDRAYIEIGNICNLKCSFCPGTKRTPRQMTVEEFTEICKKLSGKVRQLYFHVMGEPLLHPELDKLLAIAEKFGFSVSITTNGVLLPKCSELLLRHRDVLHKVSISLHAHEANAIKLSVSEYMNAVISFAKKFSALDKNAVFRLWNLDTAERTGKNTENREILDVLHAEYPDPWQERYSGYRLAYRTFLELDGIFTWPVESDAEPTDNGKCHGLTDQIAILADGTVVPCCLDSEGQIALGNIFTDTFDAILSSSLAENMIKGFKNGKMVHPVCKRCTYARRFSH